MGGIGSGKCYGKRRTKRSLKLTASDLPKLCIPQFMKQNIQDPGLYIWNGSIRLLVDNDVIILSSSEGKQLDTTYIKVNKTHCHYGGYRFFGHCPYCSKRVRDLYFHKANFACRHCFRMIYRSQNATLSTRLFLKRRKIGRWINNDEWNKPKWMRQKTFAKLREKYFDLDEQGQIADFFSLRNIQTVDKIYAKYGCALIAAELLGSQLYRF